MDHATHHKIVSFIWSIADDCLRVLDKNNERRHSCRRALAMATGVSPLPNLAGLIDLIATISFQHADSSFPFQPTFLN